MNARFFKDLVHGYFKSAHHLDDMSFQDQRVLLQNLLGGKDMEGKRNVVYITFQYIQGHEDEFYDPRQRIMKTVKIEEQARWKYSICGNFSNFVGYLSAKLNLIHKEKGENSEQNRQ